MIDVSVQYSLMVREKIRQLFIPHEGNDFRPDIFEKFSMSLMLLLVLLTFAVANIQALMLVSSQWMSSSILPAVIVDLTNEERVTSTLGALTRSTLLDEAARLKAEDMVAKGYFAHESPEGVTPWYWFEEAGYDYLTAGENLAVHFTDSSDVVDGWMKSPLHKANILNSDYTEIGVGTARGVYKGAPTVFVVQLFGTPRAQAETIPPPVVAVASETAVVPAIGERIPQTPVEQVLGEYVAATTSSVPVVVSEENVINDTQPANIDTVTYTSSSPLGDVAVLYTDTVATSRPGTPASTSAGVISATPETGFLEKAATQPHSWLQVVYGVLAILVVCALTFSFIIEWRRRQMVQMVYAGGLLIVMFLLFVLHTALTSGVSIA